MLIEVQTVTTSVTVDVSLPGTDAPIQVTVSVEEIVPTLTQ